jgi:hypothetical protein
MQPESANGVLARVRESEIQAARQKLPPPGPEQPAVLATEAHAMLLSQPVRISFKLVPDLAGEGYRWHAFHATPIDVPDEKRSGR